MLTKPRNVSLTPDEIEALLLMEGDTSDRRYGRRGVRESNRVPCE